MLDKALLTCHSQLEDLFMLRKVAASQSPSMAVEQKKPSSLLPAADIDHPPREESPDVSSTLHPAAEIERPRSALHAGDFWERSTPPQAPHTSRSPVTSTPDADPSKPLATSPPVSWHTPNSVPYRFQSGEEPSEVALSASLRSRAPSLGSLSSSFVFQPPTSPLVQQSNTTDLDPSSMDLSSSPSKSNRRRTLPPDSFRSFTNSHPASARATNFSRPLPGLRREATLPYQAHQPRRSTASSSQTQSASSPGTPAFLRSRRPSYSSDASPLQHASMVGSYEESILRGRMSTTPSKPLNFLAQIGVLGKGDCKANLRCPAHVTVPFPAVFYSYPTVSGNKSLASEDSPSPYVGNIDLENSLKPDGPKPRKQRRSPTRSSREHTYRRPD